MRFGERGWLQSAVLILLVAAPLRAEKLAPSQQQRYSMGTMFNIIVYHDSVASAERAIDQAMAEIVRLDAVMSHYSPQSELARLIREGPRGFVTVEPTLYEVIEQSLDFSRRSAGKFDVTIAPLLRVWRDAFATGRTPSGQEIADARKCVGYQHIETKPPDQIRFHSDCVELDLGGIGKGYAVDRAIAVLKAANIHHAVVNAGGSTIAAIGCPPGTGGWPITLGTQVFGHRTMLLRDSAISTSQQRLRRLPLASGEFGEIIDPQRKAPIPSETIVSVMTPSATTADALSTTLLLLPADAGKKLLEQFMSTSALWISPTGKLQDSYLPSRLRMANSQ